MHNTILLDTHIWIWLISGNKQLRSSTIKAIEQATINNTTFIAAISTWETAMLAEKKRIELDRPVFDWINTALDETNIQLFPLTPRIATVSSQLPVFHGDPADRMIVATAKTEGMTLITKDKKILQYCHKHKIASHEA